MKASVFHGPRDIRVETVPDPTIRERTDAIVRVVNAAICGSDLWFYRGVSKPQPGARTGHEFIGIVEEIGHDVRTMKKGDFVAAPFSFSDGTCEYCLDDLQTSCAHVGFWGSPGNDGGQGEFVRVPFADGTLVPLPASLASDATKRTTALALTDVMGTGHHGCVRARVRAGGTAVVIGDGAVGLCAVAAAKRLGAERIVAVGHHAGRLDIARTFGATDVIDSSDVEAATKNIIELTRGGAESVVEAVGTQATLDFGVAITRPGGIVSYVGVPTDVKTFDARRLFVSNVTIAGALAPVRAYLPEFAKDVEAGTLDVSSVFTMRLPLDRTADGYAAMDGRTAIKVALEISAA